MIKRKEKEEEDWPDNLLEEEEERLDLRRIAGVDLLKEEGEALDLMGLRREDEEERICLADIRLRCLSELGWIAWLNCGEEDEEEEEDNEEEEEDVN